MVVVSAAAFAVGAACLYYATRALRTRRAMRRLDDGRGTDAGADPAAEGETNSAAEADPRDGVSIERGFVLAVLGLLCLLFGFLAL
jgi:hypothetical protein